MSNVPWLTVLCVLPLVGAAITAVLPDSAAWRAKQVALGTTLLTLLVGVVAATQYRIGGAQFQLVEQHSWIPAFGTSWALGVDGMSLTLILMSLVLAPVCILAAWHEVPVGGRREQNYFALLLVLITCIVGVFAATDLFLFYVFFEALLFPVYFLVGSYGGPDRRRAALKFLIFGFVGGLVMLAALIGLFAQSTGGPTAMLVTNLTGLQMGETAERLMFLGFFFAFAVKAPMWPVHTWLPDTAQQATPATATLLVGILDKVGTFGMLRFCLPLFPDASRWAAPVIIVLALISVFYGAFLAIASKDIMRLIACTSISHFGFIVLGIFAFTTTAANGSALYMINHGFTTAALFLVAAMLIRRRGSQLIPDFGGWQRVTPVLAGVFLFAGLAGLALPGMGSFVSEFLVLVGTFQRHPVAGGIAALAIILAALYILLMYQRMMTGPKPELATPVRDLTAREKWVVAPLIVALLGLGFYPKPALDVINPAMTTVLQQVGVTDPPPIAGIGVDTAKESAK